MKLRLWIHSRIRTGKCSPVISLEADVINLNLDEEMARRVLSTLPSES